MKEYLESHIKIIRQQLLNKDNSVSIQHRNWRVLATEMFKIHRGLSPEILRETFVPKTSSYNLRRNDTFEKRKVHSVYHDTESLSFLGPTIWDLVPVELKQSEALYSFKLKIKSWVPLNVHAEYAKLTYNKWDFFKAVWLLNVHCYCYYHFYDFRYWCYIFAVLIKIYMFTYVCICVVCVYIYIYLYIYMYMYIYFLWLGLTLIRTISTRSTSNFWCQRFIMIALKCDIVLSELQIWGSCYSAWKASLISKYQKCRLGFQR